MQRRYCHLSKSSADWSGTCCMLARSASAIHQSLQKIEWHFVFYWSSISHVVMALICTHECTATSYYVALRYCACWLTMLRLRPTRRKKTRSQLADKFDKGHVFEDATHRLYVVYMYVVTGKPRPYAIVHKIIFAVDELSCFDFKDIPGGSHNISSLCFKKHKIVLRFMFFKPAYR